MAWCWRCVCEKTWGPVHCAPGRYGKGRKAGQYRSPRLKVRSVWGGEARTEQLTPESSVDSWKEGRAGVIQTKWRSSVVGERFYEAILASPHLWQSPDCIPIVGSARSLVPSDKRSNYTKVWCTFIYIDLLYKRGKVSKKVKFLARFGTNSFCLGNFLC